MYASPLIRTLQMLTLEELESLHPFVASPIFNIDRKGETLQLFEYLKKFFPEFDQPEIHREALSALFYSHTQNPINALQKAMSTLFNVVKKFITFKYTIIRDEAEGGASISLHEIQQQLSLLRYYSERQKNFKPSAVATLQTETDGKRKDRIDSNYFSNLYSKIDKEINIDIDFTDFSEYEFSDYYYFKYVLQLEKGINDTFLEERRSDLNILNTVEQLDEFYLVSKLRLVTNIIHNQRMSLFFPIDSEEYKRLEEVKHESIFLASQLDNNQHSKKPIIKIYSLLIRLLTQTNPSTAESIYSDLFECLLNHKGVLPQVRVLQINSIVSSFWPSRYRETKNKGFLQIIYEQLVQRNKMWNAENKMTCSFFMNMISVCLKMENVKEARNFWMNYKDQIIVQNEYHRLVEIMEAAILFEEKQFKNAKETLGHYYLLVDTDDVYLYSYAACLCVKIHYELDLLDEDEAVRMVRATKARIERDKNLPKHRWLERKAFFDMATNLYKLKAERQFDKKADIKSRLAIIRTTMDNSIIVDWEWLELKYEAFFS